MTSAATETTLAAQDLAAGHRRIAMHRIAMLVVLAVILLVALVLDLTTGPARIDLAEIVGGILDPAGLDVRTRIILWQVRLPDALIALSVGAALGLAGLETQTVLNNPLASPYTLGISAAASFGAAMAIVLEPVLSFVPPMAVLPVTAFAFSFGAALLILALSALHGGATSTVILYGIALHFLCNALTSALQYFASAEAVERVVFWTVGNLTKAGWTEVGIVTAVFLLVLPLSLRHVWVLTALRGGEVLAASAGIAVGRVRIAVMARVALLAAIGVCFVGAIAFVGLVGPHIARMLLGEDHRYLIPGACLTGAAMLSLASFLSKVLLPGVIVPVGIVTAIVGVPVFLALIAARRGEAAWR
ncbi:iron complex transport system permease protein [Rhodobium orientis]|uniref:Iron ABC transporter permease n=1 Tax=Rhodobium orientis TaxID=34017 RepID=A0A327JKL0_9HYPH|nr:iron ABC transporter permease [Rhodobium orientis]MBB4303206.1 iron complex transport system permease protein [Rhodobium orientis]MBK5951693.1 iron ABC transporter permease [Rhodobium orientis]RAI25833.1 iron ABC transporter permease [Rhodobium orientis]